jgi:hypothetical protein
MSPTVFRLTAEESQVILCPPGTGGYQEFERRIHHQLFGCGEFTGVVTLDAENFVRLVRYLGGYGDGVFQSRLRRAFTRSLCDMIGVQAPARG